MFIIGLLFLLLPPLLFVGIFPLAKRPERWRNYLWMIVLGLAIFAFSYEPTESSDTYRYYSLIERMGKLSFSDAVFFLGYEGHYVLNVWFWLAGLTGQPSIVAFITVAVVYGISGYITCDYAERCSKIDLIPSILLVQFFLLPYFSIINNIRNVTAFSIICLAIYRDISKKQINFVTILLYVIPCFIHATAITLVLLRLLFPMAKRHPLLTIFIAVFASSIIDIAYQNISMFGGNSLIAQYIIKAYRYSSDEYAATGYGATYKTYWWNNINFFVCMGYAIYTMLVAMPNVLEDGKLRVRHLRIDDPMINYTFLICVMILATNVFNAPHYWRYACALSVIIGYFLINKGITFNHLSLRQIVVLVLCFAFGVLQAIRLIPVVIKTDCLYNFMINNPITMIIKMIR